jgi:hypothetical protein
MKWWRATAIDSTKHYKKGTQIIIIIIIIIVF